MLRLARAAPVLVRRCSTDQALAAALARVLERVQRTNAATRVVSHFAEAEGAQRPTGVRTVGEKMLLRFTCTHAAADEARMTTKLISKRAYERGVVLVRCDCCDRNHLIADHLGWFGEEGQTVEDIMHARGEAVGRGTAAAGAAAGVLEWEGGEEEEGGG